MPPAERPRYTRADLEDLAARDRAGVFAALGSFDAEPRRDDAAAFAVGVAQLLDPGRVPGLAAARTAGDAEAVTAVVRAAGQACSRAAGDGVRERDAAAVAPLDGPTRQHAEDALAHRFTFYDETHQLPAAIDWDHNPGTAHWGHDLNRFSYLTPLLAAWRATGQAPFGRKAVELILHWTDTVDVSRCFAGTPYAFGSYLNNAIHVAAWARCLQAVLAEDVLLSGAEWLRILKSWHEQLAYLEVVTAGHHGNWPTIGCQGMLQVLAAFPLLRDTERWVDHCVTTLALQIDEQILPDGVQDELTPHYHAVVVRNLLTAAGCLQRLGRELAPRTVEALSRMRAYQRQTVVPSGRAQVAFNDSDPEAVPEARRDDAELGPEVFPYAGVAFLRQRRRDGDLYLAFDGGPFGRSHQHEDMLGFWLHAYGRDLLVDPGRHLYDFSEVSFLEHLRSTAAHSTICVDGKGQHARGRPDSWIATAPVPLAFAAGATEVRAAAQYDLGYGPDNAIDVVHRRQIVFAAQRFWVVFDSVVEGGAAAAGEAPARRLESRFQFAPGAVTLDGEGRALTGFEDANLLLWTTADWDLARVLCGQRAPRAGWYSGRYGKLEPAPCLTLEATTVLPFTCATLLFPYRGATPQDVTFGGDGDSVTVRSRETGEVRVRAREPSPARTS